VANPTDPVDRGAGWRLAGLGVLLVAAGAAGVAFAWFPPPPHSTAAPLSGWPARWFAAGVGWFGLAVLGGVASRWGGGNRSLRRAGCGAAVLAVACWAAALVSLAVR
jgi:hypothetical protein